VVDQSFNEPSTVLDKSNAQLQEDSSKKLSQGAIMRAWFKRTNCFNFHRKDMIFNGIHIDVIIETEQDPIRTVFVNIKSGGFKGFCAFILINRFFSILRVAFVLFTSISLGLDRYPQSSSESNFQKVSHILSTVFFVIENILLIFGGGYLNFLKEPFYVIDIVVNIVSNFL
jgi:hypothetical protein